VARRTTKRSRPWRVTATGKKISDVEDSEGKGNVRIALWKRAMNLGSLGRALFSAIRLHLRVHHRRKAPSRLAIDYMTSLHVYNQVTYHSSEDVASVTRRSSTSAPADRRWPMDGQVNGSWNPLYGRFYGTGLKSNSKASKRCDSGCLPYCTSFFRVVRAIKFNESCSWNPRGSVILNSALLTYDVLQCFWTCFDVQYIVELIGPPTSCRKHYELPVYTPCRLVHDCNLRMNKQPMGCEAQLAAQPYKHFLRWPIKPVN